MKQLCGGVCIITMLAVLSLAGCSSSDKSNSGSTAGTEQQAALQGLKDIFSKQGIVLDQTNPSCTYHDPNTGQDYTGYLGVFKDKYSNGCYYKDKNGDGTVDDTEKVCVRDRPKYCLVMTGTPYSMGYQAGYLRAEAVEKMSKQYTRQVLFAQFGLLGISLDADDPELDDIYNFFYNHVVQLIKAEEATLPQYVKDEVRGLVDGANARGKKVDYYEVLALSEGLDALFSFVSMFLFNWQDIDQATINELINLLAKPANAKHKEEIVITSGRNVTFPKLDGAKMPRAGCNGFMLTGKVTAHGETYYGRDFMFTSGGIYQDESCVMVYLPQEGYAFASAAAPGFVGQFTGINEQGLSIGIDMIFSGAIASKPGLGCSLVGRDLLQKCANLREGVDRFRTYERGVTWDFALASDEDDPQYGHGVVIEAGRTSPDYKDYTGPDLLPGWERWSLSGSPILGINTTFDYLGKLGVSSNDLRADAQNADDLVFDEQGKITGIKSGAMLRGAKWVYPGPIPTGNPSDILSFCFPDQDETDPEMLILSNHYIIPRMRFAQITPIMQIMHAAGPLADSIWRYEAMLGLIQENYGAIDFFGDNPDSPAKGSAGWIIDFLNTQRTDYYKHPDQDVEGHHVIMNNSRRELKALFGYMHDPWVGVELMPFVEWYRENQQ